MRVIGRRQPRRPNRKIGCGADDMTKKRLVILGHGMVAVRLLEELLRQTPGHFDLRVIGEELQGGYNRIQLSSLLTGEKRKEDLRLKPADWYATNGIEVVNGMRIVSIDRDSKRLNTADGQIFPYDLLVIATGSEAIRLSLPGSDLAGVVTFRDFTDIERMEEAIAGGGRAVVVGGGLLGLEAASGLARRGLTVDVVHLMPCLMERQLDAEAAGALKRELERQGLRFHLSGESAAIIGNDAGAVRALRLKDGTEISADLLVMACGIRPNTALARQAGLEIGRGIKVSDRLETSDPAIFALGECAEHRGRCYGLVEPLYEQAAVLARHLGGLSAGYTGSTDVASLKVSGVAVFSAGDIAGENGAEVIVFRDAAEKLYKKAVLRGGRLTGVVLYGSVEDGRWYADLMREQADIGAIRQALLFGRGYADAPDKEAAE